MSMSRVNGEAVRAIRRKVADYIEALVTSPGTMRGQQLRGGGAVAEFEKLLADRCGFPYCVATSNATTALSVVAIAAELYSKELIGPSNSWGGTYGPFEWNGVRIVKAASDKNGNICPKSAAQVASPATTALLATDWKGVRHAATDIRAVCDSNEWLYIEDSSWLPGVTGTLDERSLADIQIISFGPGKPLCLGEGGAILTRDPSIYKRAVAVSQHPERAASEKIDVVLPRPFINARIHPVSALIGAAVLKGG